MLEVQVAQPSSETSDIHIVIIVRIHGHRRGRRRERWIRKPLFERSSSTVYNVSDGLSFDMVMVKRELADVHFWAALLLLTVM